MKSTQLFLKIFSGVLILTICSFVLAGYAIQRTDITAVNIEEKLKAAFPSENITFSFDGLKDLNYEKTEQKWSLSIPTDKISIKSSAATVEIKSGEGDQIQIQAEGELDSKVFAHLLELGVGKDELTIQEAPNDATRRVHMRIQIPRKFQKTLEVQLVAGELVLQNLQLEKVDVKNIGGNVDLRTMTATSTRIETISGDIVLEKSNEGKVEIKTISGNVTASVMTPEKTHISVETLSGDVTNRFTEQSSGPNQLSIFTTSGDIEIQ